MSFTHADTMRSTTMILTASLTVITSTGTTATTSRIRMSLRQSGEPSTPSTSFHGRRATKITTITGRRSTGVIRTRNQRSLQRRKSLPLSLNPLPSLLPLRHLHLLQLLSQHLLKLKESIDTIVFTLTLTIAQCIVVILILCMKMYMFMCIIIQR